MQHQLNIRFDDDLNSTSFTVRDVSSYAPVTVKNPVLEIFPPSSSASVIITDIEAGFTKIVNLNTLHLNPSGAFPLPALPDQNYFLRFSVSPNTKVFIEYDYFRVVRLRSRLLDISSTVSSNRSSFTSSEYNRKVQELLWYDHLIDAMKYIAEEKHDIQSACLMYKELKHTLDKYDNCIGC